MARRAPDVAASRFRNRERLGEIGQIHSMFPDIDVPGYPRGRSVGALNVKLFNGTCLTIIGTERAGGERTPCQGDLPQSRLVSLPEK